MFGAPDRDPARDLEPPRRAAARLVTLFGGGREPGPEADDDEPLPFSTDPAELFLLNERISPHPIRLRDRPLQLALIVSLVLHLVILSQLPTGSLVQTILASRAAARHKLVADNTPFFELVQMPKQRAERPARDRAPASDLDRRAHGGEGAPADRPGSKGTTPELRLEPPGNRGAGNPQPRGAQTQTADASRAEGEKADPTPPPARVADKGESAVLAVPTTGGGHQPGVGLRGLSAYGAPGTLGGAIPNRKGGQVDLGPLSFDTEWYDWGPYAAEMLRRIKYHWDIPEVAQMGVPGVVRIHFYIERDGRVSGVEILKQSGHPPMDFAARDAILNASPLPPLPDDLIGVAHEGVTITFYYNTPVPEHTEQG